MSNVLIHICWSCKICIEYLYICIVCTYIVRLHQYSTYAENVEHNSDTVSPGGYEKFEKYKKSSSNM